MATTAKLNSQGNYEIFKNGQRVATGTASILSQYGLSPTSLTDEAITPSGQKVNPVTGQIITGDVFGQTPISFTSPQVSSPSDISGLPIAEMKLTPQEEKQVSLEKQMADLASYISGKPAFEAEKRKEFGVEIAQQAYDDLNTQLRDIQRQQQLVPLTIQKGSEGRGRTEGGVEPLEIGKRRTLAYDALTTSSLIDAAQGRLASAERKVIEAVNNKFAPDEAKYAALLNNLNLIKNSPETSIQDKNRAAKQEAIVKARQEANEKAKEEAKNILSWANKAAENMAKQGNLDAVILNKIKNSKTESEAFELAAPFLATPTTPKAETGDIAKFRAFYPTANLATPEGQNLYFEWKAREEKPIIRDFEVGGKLKRQVIDPMTGSVISETDLGVKEKKPTDDEKAIQYDKIKQRATELFADGATEEEYKQMREEIIAGGLGSYIDDFDKFAKPLLPPQAITGDTIKKEIIRVVQPQKEVLTKEEAQTAAENQLFERLDLKQGQELPEKYKEAIKQSIDEIYGTKKPWWKFW